MHGVMAESVVVLANLELFPSLVVGTDLDLGVTPAALHADLRPSEVAEFLAKPQGAAVTVDPILGGGFTVIVIVHHQAAVAGTRRHIVAGLEREGLIEDRKS